MERSAYNTQASVGGLRCGHGAMPLPMVENVPVPAAGSNNIEIGCDEPRVGVSLGAEMAVPDFQWRHELSC